MSNSKRVWIGIDPAPRSFSGLLAALAVVIGVTATACSAAAPSPDDEEEQPSQEGERSRPKPGDDPDPAGEGASTTIDVEDGDGRIDRAYALDLRTKDTTRAKRKYRLASGELPAGISVDEEGNVKGTPAASGTKKAVIYGEGACGDASCRLEVRFTMNVPHVVLLSGFGPFEGYPVNPSWNAVEPLNNLMIGGYDVRVIQVPVIWDEAVVKYTSAYDRLHPAMALASGVAADAGIRIETTARNYATGRDVANDAWPAGKIDNTGAATYPTALPVDLLKGTLEQAKYPVLISDNAGAYLCNFLFYGLMKKIEKDKPPNMIAGFIHVPEQDVVATSDLTNAWKLMIEKLATHHRELVAKTLAGGASNRSGSEAAADLPTDIPIIHTPPKYFR